MGASSIFRDIDSIQPTENFRKRIGRALKDCDFVVAVIGPGWHGPMSDGQARIQTANDWVRVEIETALQLDIPVLPVLVEDAEMPDPEVLPGSLREITEIHALAISSEGSRFYDDLNKLFSTIEKTVPFARSSAAETEAPPPASQSEGRPPPVSTAVPRTEPDPPPQPSAHPTTDVRRDQAATASRASAAAGAKAGGTTAQVPSRSDGVPWRLFEGRSILVLIVVPAIIMVGLWLYAFNVAFGSSGDGSSAIFVISVLVAFGYGIAIKRVAKMRLLQAAAIGAIVGLAIFIVTAASGFLSGSRGIWAGIGVFIVGGAVVTAAGFLLASIPWAKRAPRS